jgi:hypothetical protein
MKLTSLIVSAIGMAAFTFQPSFADCVDVTGSVNKDDRGGIAKDGSQAPLEGAKTSAEAKTPEKSGGKMPLGENPDVATSQQDVIARQHGEKTAAAKAMEDDCK